jgi:DNA-binding LytR/AlgR family response regulator
MQSNKYFFYRDEGVLKRLEIDDISFLEARANYVIVFPSTPKLSLRVPMDVLMKLLPPDRFIRVHRSFIISLYHIMVIEKDHVVMYYEPDLKGIPVARRYQKALLGKVTILEGGAR